MDGTMRRTDETRDPQYSIDELNQFFFGDGPISMGELGKKLEQIMPTATREEVYVAIDSERDYQETLPRNDVKKQTPMEHLAIIRRICRDLEDAWYDTAGQPPLDYMRKIAGVAVRCMEQHGAPLRIKSSPKE